MVNRANIKDMIPALPEEKIGKHFEIQLFVNLTLPLPIM